MSNSSFRVPVDGNPVTGMQPSHMTPPECFTTDDHREMIHMFFQTEDESILSGVWECAPSKEEIDGYPVHEMLTVISGSVTLTNEDGVSETFTSGDVVFISKGTKCIWEITETLKKYFFISA